MRDPDELLATWNDGADELLASMPPLDPDELLASVVELDRRAEAALAAELELERRLGEGMQDLIDRIAAELGIGDAP